MKESPFFENSPSVVEALRQLSFFGRLQGPELDKVLHASKLRQYGHDEEILSEGTRDPFVYLLLSGQVRVSKEKLTLAYLSGCGEVFGELSVLNDKTRSASIHAVYAATCLAVDSSFLKDPSGDRDSVHSIVYKVFSETIAYRLRTTSEELAASKKELAETKKALRSVTG